jgi:hypothetical protein
LTSIHVFEHGAGRADGKTVCTVDHAHLHLVPARVDVLPRLLREYHWQEVAPGFGDLSAAAGVGEYLYYQTPSSRCFVLPARETAFESQYLRRVFVEAIDRRREWNWRRDLRIGEVEEAYRRLAAARSQLWTMPAVF